MPAVMQEKDHNVYSAREEKGISNFKSLIIFLKTRCLGSIPYQSSTIQQLTWPQKIMMVMKSPTVMGKDHLQYASHLAVLV